MAAGPPFNAFSARTPGGFGGEHFGDPFGGGGPIQVVRAVAVAGQVVRLTFTVGPTMRSPGGAWDGRNPANYIFAVVSGQATAPAPVGVDAALIAGPARAVEADQVAVDVHTDRQLIEGVVYRITARNLRTAGGALQGAPYSADFNGTARLKVVRQAARSQDLVDVANMVDAGRWVVDDSADLAPEDPEAGTRKRVFRRIQTPRDSFSFLPGYGGPLRIKGLASMNDMALYRNSLQLQLLEEPDVVSADVAVQVDATNVVTVSVRVRTKRATTLDVVRKFGPDGAVL